jgi:hypothetical protein
MFLALGIFHLGIADQVTIGRNNLLNALGHILAMGHMIPLMYDLYMYGLHPIYPSLPVQLRRSGKGGAARGPLLLVSP